MKKTRTYTRKSWALKLLSILLIVLLLTDVLGLHCSLPIQALHQLIAKEAVGDVDVVKVLYDPDLTPSPIMRYYLCANEDVLMLCSTHFHPLIGWYYGFAAELDLDGPDPVKACYQTFSREGEGQKLYLFGRIDAPDAVALNVQAQYYYDDIQGIRSIQAQLTEDDFIEHGGKRYFLKELNSLVRPEETYPGLQYNWNGIFISVIDKNGDPIPFTSEEKWDDDTDTRRRIWCYTHTSFA